MPVMQTGLLSTVSGLEEELDDLRGSVHSSSALGGPLQTAHAKNYIWVRGENKVRMPKAGIRATFFLLLAPLRRAKANPASNNKLNDSNHLRKGPWIYAFLL
jgi:hypothetical protein